MICDAHCDTLYTLHTMPGKETDVTLERLRAGGVSVQTMAMYVGPGGTVEQVDLLMRGMLAQLDRLKESGWRQLSDPSEAAEGETGILLSIEGCEPFAPGLHTIAEYRERGVRMAAVTWNHDNALGTPAVSGKRDGLKPYGLKAVREMQRLGIAVDVSHLNEAGFYDILGKTDRPPLASHSCCAALRPHPRNLTDAQLRALFSAGGYVGVNFYPSFLSDSPCGLDRVVDHIDHMHQLGGEGKVGFGSDFDGIETKPEGLSDPSCFPALLNALQKRGYSQSDIRAVAGGNFLRYFERISR